MASFRVNRTFRVATQGLMIVGHITEGAVALGDEVTLAVNRSVTIGWPIAGVESVLSAGAADEVGLALANLDESILELFEAAFRPGVEVVVVQTGAAA